MSSIGTGYDLSASTFSPDGRVFQVEYAMKAVENSSTAIGIRCKDGVVFGVEKLVLSKLYLDKAKNIKNFMVKNTITTWNKMKRILQEPISLPKSATLWNNP
ncbi:unnamed protein product [Oncorhynchus mykiss]|uniref:Proteasome subunit alpha type n=1 Tax=Oncorhynchus mykiss TaxID=8022 RepID=A0A060WDP5_ONCMY|nr:unnamed protein product [Oncorhynchus mykiss]